jgi:outer membrane protein assembly factor BamA
MSGPPALRIILVIGACTFLLAPPVRAQSPQTLPARCVSPLYGSDAFKELIGLRIFPKIVVDEVQFDGATHLTGADHDQLIASLAGHEFDADHDWLAEPLETVRAFWRDRGYFRVNVTADEKNLETDSTRRRVALTFHVEEGPQYRLKDVGFRSSDVDVPLVFPPEQLRKMVPMADGNILSVKEIRDGLDAFRRFYGSQGYIDSVSTISTEIDNASHQISLLFWLDQGRQFRVGTIEFVGKHPEAQAILRSQLKVGEIFSETTVKNFYEQNKPLLPVGATRSDSYATRNQKSGTVSLIFDFRDCPR